MTKSVEREQKAIKIAEAHSSLGGFIFGILIELIAVSKKAFEVVGLAFFMLNWVNEAFTLTWQSIAFKWSHSKNLHKTGSLLVEWIKFIFSSFMVFGSALLVGTAQVASLGIMLILSPFICLIKAIYYLIRTITVDNQQEAEVHFSDFKKNIIAGIISGLLGICIATLIYVPALPLAAAVCLATFICLIVVPPIVLGLGSQLLSLGKSWLNSLNKLWRKKQGLQGPGYLYDFKSGEDLDNQKLETHIIYVDKLEKDGFGHKFLSYRIKDAQGFVCKGTFKQELLPQDGVWPKYPGDNELKKLRPHFDLFATSLLQAIRQPETDVPLIKRPVVNFKPQLNSHSGVKIASATPKILALSKDLANYHAKEDHYHAHLSIKAKLSVNELILDANRQIERLKSHSGSFFQESKRQQKIEALEILIRVISQWNNLYQNKRARYGNYNSIILDSETEISRVLNPHLDENSVANREIIIKRIEQYVLVNFPDAYQSFFREQGSVATTFQQGFDLMRRMKTQNELDEEKYAIEAELTILKNKFLGFRGHFTNDEQQIKYQNSVQLLFDLFSGLKTNVVEKINSNVELKFSQKANGARWKLSQRIIDFKDSENLFFEEKGFFGDELDHSDLRPINYY
ncbi:MAG: hypothetical protein H0U70_05600 [Tatlockia sp.]|nr:hypothetical protein [Tatlockia sp.]